MKYDSILVIKAFAIVGVVFHHIGNRRFNHETQEIIKIFPTIFSWSVFAFIAASGWLHSFSESKNRKNFVPFLRHRFNRLMVPFFILTALYAAIWQIARFFDIKNVGVNLPHSYFGKIVRSVDPMDYHPVGEQLYFLPLLFFISVFHHLFGRNEKFKSAYIVLVLSLIANLSLKYFQGQFKTILDLTIFAIYCYAGGFIMFHHHNKPNRWVLAVFQALILIGFLGFKGIPKAIPLILLASSHQLEFFSNKITRSIGEASGTIFAYHTPFLLHPMVIVCAHLPNPFQIPALVVSVALSIALCTAFYFFCRHRKFNFILL